MKIVIERGSAMVYTPYNQDFVKKIKLVGGAKWDAENKCWIVPEKFVDIVREIMIDVYGYSDISTNDSVALKITFNEDAYEFNSDVTLFGKTISSARGRDSGARVGLDVSFLSGGVESGGSVKNWKSIVKKDSVAVLEDVNRKIYEKGEDKYDITVEVINDTPTKYILLDEFHSFFPIC